LKDDILKVIQSTEPMIIQKYLEDYLLLLRNKIDQYTAELMTQSISYPLTLVSLDVIDQKLKEFVRLHHLDLLRTINYLVAQLNSKIHINKLLKQLSLFHLTTKQVSIFRDVFLIC
jgi:hypothetical protein